MPARNDSSISPLAVAEHYSFPATSGKGQRIAILELGGGFHKGDLRQCCRELGQKVPVVRVHAIQNIGSDTVGPLTVTHKPLGKAALRELIAAFNAPGATVARVQKQYGDDGTFQSFMSTFEASMDVQLVAALAPGAEIDVYFAPRLPQGLAAAIDAAVAGKATVISFSWGSSESDWGEGMQNVDLIDAAMARAAKQGITICCSSGDYGARNRSPADVTSDRRARVNYPASSPWALACGGTSLRMRNGAFVGETAWNATVLGVRRASGGGMSGYFPRPAFQQALATPRDRRSIWLAAGHGTSFDGRWVPDVSAHADRACGYRIVLGGLPFLADGTSAAAPVWAALIARVAEAIGRPVGWFNALLPELAAGGAFGDITKGDNAVPLVARSFTAAKGWDPCTGYGTPNGERIVALLSSARGAAGRTGTSAPSSVSSPAPTSRAAAKPKRVATKPKRAATKPRRTGAKPKRDGAKAKHAGAKPKRAAAKPKRAPAHATRASAKRSRPSPTRRKKPA